jgi:omega-6 fatty acid desaturase (delta-12 desaturase)
MVKEYEKPSRKLSLLQVANSIIPYLALWFLMYLCLDVSYWLTLLLAVPAAGFKMRTFIIQHDCGHGAFFRSQKANNRLGFFLGILTFIPYQYWRHDHAIHHATSGNLDVRDSGGDIWTLTVKEYAESSFRRRFHYRVYRNPLVMFVIAPLVMFAFRYRFSSGKGGERERNSVYLTNFALLSILVLAFFTIGLKAYLLVQLPISLLSSSAGVWLFYVQHQFEDVYWERAGDWDYVAAAIDGSSYYHLPRVLQFFTGNIGFHHVHHLSPRVPNYNLEKCHLDNELFKEVKSVTLLSSLKSLSFRLWDEEGRRLVGFRAARAYTGEV